MAALLLTFCVATTVAHAMSRARFRGRDLVDALLLLPLVLPPVVTGYALLLLLGRRGIVGAWLFRVLDWTLIFTPFAAVLASSVVAFPLMYASAKTAFCETEETLQDAARMLGASKSRVFWTVTFPLCRAGLATGATLSFARALGEFGATILVAGNIAGKTTTATTALWTAASSGDMETAKKYAMFLAAFNFSFVVLLNFWLRKKARRERKNVA